MARRMIDQNRLKEVLHYDSETGVFVWREKISVKVVVGRKAGGLNKSGYVVVGLFGKLFYAHQLAWLYMTGETIPQIDHENGVRDDNRWTNLRPATHSQNVLNAKRAVSNTSGFKGATWHKGAGRWMGQIVIRGKRQYLGLFDTAEDAHAAYMNAARAAEPQFARAE